MNPADVAQSALPIASADVSLIALFLQAHWIVKGVMLGLSANSLTTTLLPMVVKGGQKKLNHDLMHMAEILGM